MYLIITYQGNTFKAFRVDFYLMRRFWKRFLNMKIAVWGKIPAEQFH